MFVRLKYGYALQGGGRGEPTRRVGTFNKERSSIIVRKAIKDQDIMMGKTSRYTARLTGEREQRPLEINIGRNVKCVR